MFPRASNQSFTLCLFPISCSPTCLLPQQTKCICWLLPSWIKGPLPLYQQKNTFKVSTHISLRFPNQNSLPSSGGFSVLYGLLECQFADCLINLISVLLWEVSITNLLALFWPVHCPLGFHQHAFPSFGSAPFSRDYHCWVPG